MLCLSKAFNRDAAGAVSRELWRHGKLETPKWTKLMQEIGLQNYGKFQSWKLSMDIDGNSREFMEINGNKHIIFETEDWGQI